MELIVDPAGGVRCIYDETLELTSLGEVKIRRASHVEPDAAGAWWADLKPAAGPRLGPFQHRSTALRAEMQWLEAHLHDLPF